ncbi:hypothetical protein AN932_24395 [Mycobacterium intracellulare subsp. chimaera]|nr:hypothetical protein AN932_24395 [Mycobacterium intracellulare subsp. chimaera]
MFYVGLCLRHDGRLNYAAFREFRCTPLIEGFGRAVRHLAVENSKDDVVEDDAQLLSGSVEQFLAPAWVGEDTGEHDDLRVYRGVKAAGAGAALGGFGF